MVFMHYFKVGCCFFLSLCVILSLLDVFSGFLGDVFAFFSQNNLQGIITLAIIYKNKRGIKMYVELHGEKDKILILCAVGGYFGLHRYFVGKWKTGLLWTFTAGVFLIGWIVDLILIAIGKFKNKDGFTITN